MTEAQKITFLAGINIQMDINSKSLMWLEQKVKELRTEQLQAKKAPDRERLKKQMIILESRLQIEMRIQDSLLDKFKDFNQAR